MAIPQPLKKLHEEFWNEHHDEFDMSLNEGCGAYTEAWVRHAQSHGFPLVGHLKKNPSQTQYNGHANDSFLYKQEASADNPLYQAVDIIGNAEAKPPYNNTNNQPPKMNWGIDEPRYTDKDWMAKPGSDSGPVKMVPWFGYNEESFERLKRMLRHDYERRPQNADFDVSVWSARYFHNCYMGPEGVPLGEDGALKRVKPELCASLKIPMDDYYG